MKLLIDAGNTRIKWAVVNGGDWLHSGVLPSGQADKLPGLFTELRAIQQVWASNVAGEEVAQHIRNFGIEQTHFVVAQKFQCGVSNAYSDAAQLGSDRWASLIAAWHQVRGTCLVVNSGTATTIDTLTGQGEFLGGLILPGVELMQRSLVAATDRLKTAQGKYVPLPRNTADALYSGAIQASCGAIERHYALLDDDSAPVVISGGAAETIREHLNLPIQIMDNLVLQGLLIISREVEH